ncbi:uncharacterized protein GGS22DRAFT_200396 [Annulohypoxylon maeteangense]|uniref:uncharacterized protein n=1 Tax=Annulohypoxylon maeteangense TaxID=1927788 RepID=UPI002007A088|nr:uncharacterized protein GGS22DRAFT_200396 [Annulohypoxylon maeteangense]KAI0884689.1 hypothetical protein GGS22DRAFT_200396 [Annulohypoxylon maeteangense]
MSKRGIKGKPGVQLLSEESDDPFVKGNNAKRNKLSHTNKNLSRLDEYEEDEGREGSRNFQRWGEIFESNTKGEAMKSKTFMKNFGERVQKQKDRVHLWMQEQDKEFAKSKGQVVAHFEETYSTAAAISLRASGVSKEDHALFKEAQSIISEGYSLLKQFKETDEQLKNYKLDLPTAKWKQDGRDIKELLACGREHGEKLIEKKLAPKAYPSPHPDRPKVDERDNMVSELFKDSGKAEEGDNWGTIAADQMKKFSTVAETIPINILERSKYRTHRE